MLIWLVLSDEQMNKKDGHVFPTFSLLKKWAICATASKLNTFQLIHWWEKDLLIQVSKFYCWCGAVDPMIHVTKRLKNAFGLQIVSTSFEDGWTKTTRVWRVSISSSKKPTLSPHPKTEQDSLHAPEICFKLLCSRLLEASCTTLIILTIRSLKKKTPSQKDPEPIPFWLGSALQKRFDSAHPICNAVHVLRTTRECGYLGPQEMTKNKWASLGL